MKKKYIKPQITRIRLEDKPAVALAVCKESLDNSACAQQGFTPLFEISPS